MGKLFTCTSLLFLGAIFLAITACSTDAAAPPASSPSATPPTPAPTTTPAPVARISSPPSTATRDETPTVETVRPEINIPEPEKYPQMSNDDLDGAASAARYFLDLYGYAMQSGDLTAWENISADNCRFCQNATELVEDIYSNGGWIEDHEVHTEIAQVYYPMEYPFYVVSFHAEVTELNRYNHQGILVLHDEPAIYPQFALAVQYISENEWELVGVSGTDLEE